jgi:UDP-3-O-[3-hydroxymyristoyl] glucosamine N-acyltransferase
MKTREIAEVVGGELVGDGEVEVSRVAALGQAGAGEIAFAEKSDAELGDALCVLVGRGFDGTASGTIIKVEDPKLAFSLVARILHPSHRPEPFIHQTALVRDSAHLGEGVIVEPFVCVDENSFVGAGTYLHASAIVGRNVRIGANCEVLSHVVIRDNCSIGDNVVLHAGVVIGAPGFGYVRDKPPTTPSPEAGATPPIQEGSQSF